MLRVSVFLLALFVCSSPATAQPAAIAGVVIDASGAPVAGAPITLEAAGQPVATAKTGAHGRLR